MIKGKMQKTFKPLKTLQRSESCPHEDFKLSPGHFVSIEWATEQKSRLILLLLPLRIIHLVCKALLTMLKDTLDWIKKQIKSNNWNTHYNHSQI